MGYYNHRCHTYNFRGPSKMKNIANKINKGLDPSKTCYGWEAPQLSNLVFLKVISPVFYRIIWAFVEFKPIRTRR
jgi:hypothetical protein